MRRAVIALLLALSPLAAAAEVQQMSVPCQQNRDNRKLIIDEDLLPRGARYHVDAYSVQEPGYPWTSGVCSLTLTAISRQ